MKVRFDKKKLMEVLDPASSISQTKNTLMTVDGLLFECPPDRNYGEYDVENPDSCRISAFDLDKGMRACIECEVIEPGAFVVNTQSIKQRINILPEGNVDFDIDENGILKIVGGNTKYEVSTISADQFPSMPHFTGEKKYVMPQYKLRNVISETVFSVAVNDQRAAFNGAFFQIKEGNLVVVGCDGQRLAAAKVRIGEDIEETSFIVPKKFLTELVRMLEDSEEEVTMMVGAKHVIFRFRNMYFFTRLIEAEYINFEKLLPKSYMTQAYVSKADFIAALERAAIVADEKTGGSSKSHVKLEFENNSIRMSALSQDGSVNEKVPAAIDGQDLAIGFNCRFLLESLKSTPNECDRIRIRMNTPLMGAIIEPAEGSSINETNPDSSVYGNRENRQNKVEDEEKGTFTYFVMPIKMNR